MFMNMGLRNSVIIMVVGGVILQYVISSIIMANKLSNIRNSIGKFYMSVIMGLIMGILEVLMHDMVRMRFSVKYYIILISLFSIFVYLYRKQVAIDDKQYLNEMIEHHSMALLTSTEILNKTHDYNVAKLAKDIVSNQTDEIDHMKELITKKDEIIQ